MDHVTKTNIDENVQEILLGKKNETLIQTGLIFHSTFSLENTPVYLAYLTYLNRFTYLGSDILLTSIVFI